MTPEESVTKLREAGLHVRDLGEVYGILGGSHVDRSSYIGVVENGFLLKVTPSGRYEVDLADGIKLTMCLEDAVNTVLHRVISQPDIEAPPHQGPQEY